MHSPLQTLFLIEGVLKVIGGSIFFLAPTTVLKNLQDPPYSTTSLPLLRNFGTQTVAFALPLILAAKSNQVGSRRIVYWTLLGRECLLAAGLLAQIGWSHLVPLQAQQTNSAEAEDIKALEEGLGQETRGRQEDEVVALEKWQRGSWLWIAELAPFIVARIWILQKRKSWFENVVNSAV